MSCVNYFSPLKCLEYGFFYFSTSALFLYGCGKFYMNAEDIILRAIATCWLCDLENS